MRRLQFPTSRWAVRQVHLSIPLFARGATSNTPSTEQRDRKDEASSHTAIPSSSTTINTDYSLNWRESLFSSWRNGLVTAFGGCCAIAGVTFLLWKPFKQDSVQQTAAVASEALGDVKVRGQAVNLSKEVVESVLRDPKSVELLVEVITSLLQKKDTQKAVTSFIQSVFADEYTLAISRKFVVDIVDSKHVREQLDIIAYDLVTDLLKNPNIRRQLSELLLESTSDALRDKKLHTTTASAIRSAVYFTLPFTSPPSSS